MADFIFYFAILFQIFLFLILIRLARNKKFGVLLDSALNPVTFLNVLFVFFALDFCALFNANNAENIYETKLIVDSLDIAWAYLFFVIGCYAMAIGLFLALIKEKKYQKNLLLFKGNNRRQFIFYLTILFAIGAVLVLGQSFDMLISGKLTRQTFFNENKILYIIFSMLTPAYAAYIADKKALDFKVLFATFIVLFVLFFIGSRGALLLVFLVYAYLYNATVKKISNYVYVLAIPVISVGLIYFRYYFRESWRYSSIGDFIDNNGGVFSVFFNTAEVGMAEVISILLRYGDHIQRFPFESFIAALMYPLPRSIIEFKPLGGDAAVTSIFSPDRWDLSKSEITITLFSDYYLQFGMLFSFIGLSLTAYIWMKALLYGVRMNSNGVILMPFLMWSMYILLRSSVFNVAGLIWAWLFVAILCNYKFTNKSAN